MIFHARPVRFNPLARCCVALRFARRFVRALQLRAVVAANALPQPTGYVSDFAHVLNADDKQKLEQFCTRVEQQLGVQFALVTVDTLGDAPIEDYALDLFRHWGIGSKKDNSGVLLLLAIKDRRLEYRLDGELNNI